MHEHYGSLFSKLRKNIDVNVFKNIFWFCHAAAFCNWLKSGSAAQCLVCYKVFD